MAKSLNEMRSVDPRKVGNIFKKMNEAKEDELGTTEVKKPTAPKKIRNWVEKPAPEAYTDKGPGDAAATESRKRSGDENCACSGKECAEKKAKKECGLKKAKKECGLKKAKKECGLKKAKKECGLKKTTKIEKKKNCKKKDCLPKSEKSAKSRKSASRKEVNEAIKAVRESIARERREKMVNEAVAEVRASIMKEKEEKRAVRESIIREHFCKAASAKKEMMERRKAEAEKKSVKKKALEKVKAERKRIADSKKKCAEIHKKTIKATKKISKKSIVDELGSADAPKIKKAKKLDTKIHAAGGKKGTVQSKLNSIRKKCESRAKRVAEKMKQKRLAESRKSMISEAIKRAHK